VGEVDHLSPHATPSNAIILRCNSEEGEKGSCLKKEAQVKATYHLNTKLPIFALQRMTNLHRLYVQSCYRSIQVKPVRDVRYCALVDVEKDGWIDMRVRRKLGCSLIFAIVPPVKRYGISADEF
jgi:hypothetical protein